MKISVNILCWDNLDVLKYSIPQLLRELESIKHEIIVIDNGSNDGTSEYIKSVMGLGNIQFIQNPENMGISIGKNQGINASSGEYVFMLDGDILPVENSIQCLMNWLDENPDKDAIGMYPNRFCQDMNKGHLKPCEEWCEKLFEPVPHKCACLFYGLYRKKIFDNGLRMDMTGEYGKVGYGWEDHDFFMRMKTLGITQYVAHINHIKGRYHHRINSSIRNMGDATFRESMKARCAQFKRTWENAA